MARPRYIEIMGGTRKGFTRVFNGKEVPTLPKTFEPCPIHFAIATSALERLTGKQGIFRQEDILKEVKLDGKNPVDMTRMKGSIHWDYITRWLKEEYQADLIPLSEHAFTSQGKEDMKLATSDNILPENRKVLADGLVAVGRGKKVVGYANYSEENAILAYYRLRNKAAVLKGVQNAFNTKVGVAKKAGVLERFDEIESKEPVKALEHIIGGNS